MDKGIKKLFLKRKKKGKKKGFGIISLLHLSDSVRREPW